MPIYKACLSCGYDIVTVASQVNKRRCCSVECLAKYRQTLTRINLTKVAAAWLAGFVDGEGSIGIHLAKSTNGRRYFGSRLEIVNTNASIIEEIKAMIGYGSIYHAKWENPNWNDAYHYRLVGVQAQAVLRVIRPYLRIKGNLADLVLSIPRRTTHTSATSGRIYAQQVGIYEKVKAINVRGKRYLL